MATLARGARPQQRDASLKSRPSGAGFVNRSALDQGAWTRSSVARSAWPSPPARDRRPGMAVLPHCRLRLEGREGPEGDCDILELSPEGVTIAVPEGCVAWRGQEGQLLIGPAEGDHYAVPVAVRWVRATARSAIVGLAIPEVERWTYRRTDPRTGEASRGPTHLTHGF
jgi:hypothetical protein